MVEASLGTDIALDISNTMTFRNIAAMTLDLELRKEVQDLNVHVNSITTLNTYLTLYKFSDSDIDIEDDISRNLATISGIFGISREIINVNSLTQPITSDKAQTLAACTLVTNIIQNIASLLSLDESVIYDEFAKVIDVSNNLDISSFTEIKHVITVIASSRGITVDGTSVDTVASTIIAAYNSIKSVNTTTPTIDDLIELQVFTRAILANTRGITENDISGSNVVSNLLFETSNLTAASAWDSLVAEQEDNVNTDDLLEPTRAEKGARQLRK